MSYEKRIKPTDCPDAEHLERFGRGALPEELIAMFSDHLTQCDQCCRELSNQDDRHDPLITALFDSSIEFNEAEIEQMELLGGDGFGFGIDGEDTFKRSTTCVGRIIDESIPRIDNYTVQRLIGRGGMGSVYAAIHCSLDRPVAIKVLSPARTADESATTRFRGEMKAVGRVNHPNMIQALDAGQSDGVLYLTMELIAGLDLSSLLRRGGPIDSSNACEIIRQAALGLHHVHEQGLTHRDIKPSNLMLAMQSEERFPEGFDGTCRRISDSDVSWVSQQSVTVKVADLGLSLYDDSTSAAELTYTGQIMGTIEYMAPEQVRDARRVDRRADIYSLGATLYRMLCGQVPFAHLGRDVTLEKLNEIAAGLFPPIGSQHPGLTPAVCDLVSRMMEVDVERRFQSMIDVVQAAAPLCRDSNLSGLLAHRWSVGPLQEVPPERSTPNEESCFDTESGIGRGNFGPADKLVTPTEPGTGRQAASLPMAIGFAALLLLLLGAVGLSWTANVSQSSSEPSTAVMIGVDEKLPVMSVGPVIANDLGSAATNDHQADDRWSHLPIDAPKPAIAPFDAQQALVSQRQWAEYLGTDITRTILMPSGESFQLQLLPPGQFQMGTSAEETAEVLDRNPDFKEFVAALLSFESPKFTAMVREPVWFGRHEVTIGLFRSFVDATGYLTDAERLGGSEGVNQGKPTFGADLLWKSSPGRTLNDQDPVTSVSYNDATRFCAWLSDQVSDETFQLPTEGQWEYACRAGSEALFTYGADPELTAHHEWFRNNSGLRIHSVGELEANPFGLFDLQGNVSEWCRDPYRKGDVRQSISGEHSDPAASETLKVFRGGYWGGSMETCRPAVRQPRDKSISHHQIGFRVVCEISL